MSVLSTPLPSPPSHAPVSACLSSFQGRAALSNVDIGPTGRICRIAGLALAAVRRRHSRHHPTLASAGIEARGVHIRSSMEPVSSCYSSCYRYVACAWREAPHPPSVALRGWVWGRCTLIGGGEGEGNQTSTADRPPSDPVCAARPRILTRTDATRPTHREGAIL